MIVHQIEALKEAGVDEVVLAINYQPQFMHAFIAEWEPKLGIKITISQVRLRHPECTVHGRRDGGCRSALSAKLMHQLFFVDLFSARIHETGML